MLLKSGSLPTGSTQPQKLKQPLPCARVIFDSNAHIFKASHSVAHASSEHWAREKSLLEIRKSLEDLWWCWGYIRTKTSGSKATVRPQFTKSVLMLNRQTHYGLHFSAAQHISNNLWKPFGLPSTGPASCVMQSCSAPLLLGNSAILSLIPWICFNQWSSFCVPSLDNP